jgi:hypothetical protein
MRFYFVTLPWVVPGLVASFVLAALTRRQAARVLGTTPANAMLLIVATGLVLAATVTPLGGGGGNPGIVPGTCDTTRLWLAPVASYVRLNDISLNVVLFVPLGVAIGLLPLRWTTAEVVALAIGLPFAIEIVQLAFPMLERSCQSADIIDNLFGTGIGIALGVAARTVRAVGAGA